MCMFLMSNMHLEDNHSWAMLPNVRSWILDELTVSRLFGPEKVLEP